MALAQSIVVAIDPSLTGTAVTIMDENAEYEMYRFTSEAAPGLVGRFARYKELVSKVKATIAGRQPELILIESYSYGSRGAAITQLAEYGGLLRAYLLKLAPVIEVPPNALKLFVTGKGQAKKPAIAVGVYKHWGQEFATDDETDAYGLARMAVCKVGWFDAKNEGQRKAWEKLK